MQPVEEVEAWSRDDRLGICLQTRLCKVFDVEDEALAERVEDTLRPLIAELASVSPDQVPLRFRENSSKFAMIVRCEAVLSKRVINLGGTNKIEFLGNGQQAIIAGTQASLSTVSNPTEVASWRRENGASIKDAASHFGISTTSVKRYCGSIGTAGATEQG